jgi:hypothetical protein
VIYQGSVRGTGNCGETGSGARAGSDSESGTGSGVEDVTGDIADVAVKLFKGELTSDGLPYSEMAACMRAGAHPNLITVQGKIDSHPEGQAGLVMSLVGSHYRNLAGPPSLESCTRDVYAPELRFALSEALRIAVDMASVAEQLHANGIMHGDFYAHNILVEDAGHALLGDFGAACFVSDTNAKQARGLERIEVRAFGCLLEELLERVGMAPESAVQEITIQETAIQKSAIQNELLILRDRCLSPDAQQRPSFQAIVSLLKQQVAAQ